MQDLNKTKGCLSERPCVILILTATAFVYLFYVFFSSPSFNNVSVNNIKNVRTSCPSLQSQLRASEYSYQIYMKKRRDLMGNDPSKISPWVMHEDVHMYFFDYFLPAFNCPYTIQRIGKLGDGGKWVCGFDQFDKQHDGLKPPNDRPCIVYSFGVAGESSYEAEFLERTDCHIFGFDGSVNQIGYPLQNKKNPRIHFTKTFLGHETKSDQKTLATLMKENNHTWIDFLKMDVEGAEFSVFEQIFKDFEILPFGQLQLEIHADHEGKRFPTVFKMWEMMESKGLRAFKNEVNHAPCVRSKQRPSFMEYSFLNIKGKYNNLITFEN